MKSRIIAVLFLLGFVLHGFAADKKSAKQDPSKTGTLLDGFEINDWLPSLANQTSLKTLLVSGKEGKALELDYDLKETKQWVQISKEIAIPSMDGQALQFYLKAMGKKNNLEIKLVDEDGSNFGYKMPLKTEGQWELMTVSFPEFSYWWGGDATLQGVKQIWIAVSSLDGGAGTVALDELRLVPWQQTKVKWGLIDACDSLEGWKADGDQGTSTKLNLVPGKEGKAVELEYDLAGGKWLQMCKNIPITLNPKASFKFFFKYTGDANLLEFKIADKDQSTFGKKISFSDLKPGVWQPVKISVSDLSYWWGGDDKLDMENVKGVWFGVTPEKGSKGTIAIDQLTIE